MNTLKQHLQLVWGSLSTIKFYHYSFLLSWRQIITVGVYLIFLASVFMTVRTLTVFAPTGHQVIEQAKQDFVNNYPNTLTLTFESNQLSLQGAEQIQIARPDYLPNGLLSEYQTLAIITPTQFDPEQANLDTKPFAVIDADELWLHQGSVWQAQELSAILPVNSFAITFENREEVARQISETIALSLNILVLLIVIGSPLYGASVIGLTVIFYLSLVWLLQKVGITTWKLGTIAKVSVVLGCVSWLLHQISLSISGIELFGTAFWILLLIILLTWPPQNRG